MRYAIGGLTALATILCSAQGYASNPKMGSQLNQKIFVEKQATSDVLVYMKENASFSHINRTMTKEERTRAVWQTLRATATSSQTDIKLFLESKNLSYSSYYITNLIVVKNAPSTLIEELANRDDVARVLGNPAVESIPKVTKDMLRSEPAPKAVGANVSATGAPDVWSMGFTGQGIIVAGQDTGIDWDHPGLINQYRGKQEDGTYDHNYNWHDAIRSGSGNSCGVALTVPCDDNGHGTHTLGNVVGDDGDGNQVGMAPGSKWVGCRNMDEGVGTPQTYIECFQFFLAPWPAGGDPTDDGNPDLAADVINNSWGCPRSEGCEGDEFLPIVNALNAAGIMTVAAAGNAGSGCGSISDGPAHHTAEVYAVGAYDHRNNNIASFSSRGPSGFDGGVGPDISAPGVSVRSTVPGGGYSGSWWSGTSMASPHVAGAVALLWSAVPEMRGDIEGTSALLNETAQSRTTSQNCGGVSGESVPNNTYGHGLLNIKDAVDTARARFGR